MIPEKIILNPNGTSYYTIRKGLVILADIYGKHLDEAQAELKQLSPMDDKGIERLKGKIEGIKSLALELEMEMKKFT